jgi:uncharacterized membrane protein
MCWFNRGKVGHTAPTETSYVAPGAAAELEVVEANAELSKAVEKHTSATALKNIVMLRCREAMSVVWHVKKNVWHC